MKKTAIAIPVEFALDAEVIHLLMTRTPLEISFPLNAIDTNNRSLVVDILKKNPKAFLFFYRLYRKDEEILNIVKHEPRNFHLLPKEVQKEPFVFVHNFDKGMDYNYIHLFENKEFVMRIVRFYPDRITLSPLKTDPDVLREAILYGYYSNDLELPEEWLNDKQFMLKAIKSNNEWYQYSKKSQSLRKDLKFVEDAAKFGARIDNIGDYDLEFKLKLIEINPQNIEFDTQLLDDKEIILKYISKITFRLSKLESDVNVLREALKYNVTHLEHAPLEIWRDCKNILAPFKGVSLNFPRPEILKNETEIIDFLIDNGNIDNLDAWDIPRDQDTLLRILKNAQYNCLIVPEELNTDMDFVRKAIAVQPKYFSDIHTDLCLNTQKVFEFCKENPLVYAFIKYGVSQFQDNNLMASKLTGYMYSTFESTEEFDEIVKKRMEMYDLGMDLPQRFKSFHIVPDDEEMNSDDEYDDYEDEDDEEEEQGNDYMNESDDEDDYLYDDEYQNEEGDDNEGDYY